MDIGERYVAHLEEEIRILRRQVEKLMEIVLAPKEAQQPPKREQTPEELFQQFKPHGTRTWSEMGRFLAASKIRAKIEKAKAAKEKESNQKVG